MSLSQQQQQHFCHYHHHITVALSQLAFPEKEIRLPEERGGGAGWEGNRGRVFQIEAMKIYQVHFSRDTMDNENNEKGEMTDLYALFGFAPSFFPSSLGCLKQEKAFSRPVP